MVVGLEKGNVMSGEQQGNQDILEGHVCLEVVGFDAVVTIDTELLDDPLPPVAPLKVTISSWLKQWFVMSLLEPVCAIVLPHNVRNL